MSIRYSCKTSLLANQYDRLIISENDKGNYIIKTDPSRLAPNKLSGTGNYVSLEGNDKEVVKNLVLYYLRNHNICMIDKGRLRNHSGEYLAANAYSTFIYGLEPVDVPMYLKTTENEEYEKLIEDKYTEDRERSIDKIVSCDDIYVDVSHISSYIIKNNKTYITLKGEYDELYERNVEQSELDFLNRLIKEFIIKNKIDVSTNPNYYYKGDTIELHNDEYTKFMVLQNELLKQFLNTHDSLNIKSNQITIDEYVKTIK